VCSFHKHLLIFRQLSKPKFFLTTKNITKSFFVFVTFQNQGLSLGDYITVFSQHLEENFVGLKICKRRRERPTPLATEFEGVL